MLPFKSLSTIQAFIFNLGKQCHKQAVHTVDAVSCPLCIDVIDNTKINFSWIMGKGSQQNTAEELVTTKDILISSQLKGQTTQICKTGYLLLIRNKSFLNSNISFQNLFWKKVSKNHVCSHDSTNKEDQRKMFCHSSWESEMETDWLIGEIKGCGQEEQKWQYNVFVQEYFQCSECMNGDGEWVLFQRENLRYVHKPS